MLLSLAITMAIIAQLNLSFAKPRVHILKELRYCYHGNHQKIMLRFPNQSMSLLLWTASSSVCFP